MTLINQIKIIDFLNKLDLNFNKSGDIYLIGETSAVFEGWQPWADELQFSAKIDEQHLSTFNHSLMEVQKELGFEVLQESLAEVIPLPENFEARRIPVNPISLKNNNLRFYHFDPYSVAFRFIARGDEKDYQLALTFLKQGWINVVEMDSIITQLLTHFSSETIQQDPAEFRRKYKGLLQMWDACPIILQQK